jgi:hypothetical protein
MTIQSTFWNVPQRDGILLADLTRCEPQSAISVAQKPGCWYQIPYATQSGIEGVMVAKGALTSPPDLHLALPVEGWHAIYLGIYPGSSEESLQPKVKLSDERMFESVLPSSLGHRRAPDGTALSPGPLPGAAYAVEEFFWKAAALGGQELILSHAKMTRPTVIQFAFVRLVPMSDDEVAEYQQACGCPDTRILAIEDDGQAYFHGLESIEAVLESFELECLRDTDVGKLFLGTAGLGAGSMLYPTKIGTPDGAGAEEMATTAGQRSADSLLGFLARGEDPLKAVVDYVNPMGIDVYLGFRMGTMATTPPSWAQGVPFWVEHPEWRCHDRDGNTVPRLSMAYPEVRRFYVGLFEELAAYGVKGVQVIYTRRPPFVLFEPPVIEDFKKEYGIDPRELPDDPERRNGVYTTDERLERHWAGYVTTFMRELREALDAYRAPDGGRVEVVANVRHNEEKNRIGGLDLHTWALEGLVDILAPYTGGDGTERVDYAYFRSVIDATSCVFYEDVTPRTMPGCDYAEHARRAYEGGAAGLAFWDSGMRIMNKTQWHTLRRLGHREDLERMAQQPEDYNLHPLKRLYDWNPELRYA